MTRSPLPTPCGGDGARQLRHLIAQRAIGEALLAVGDGRIVDQRRLLGAAALDVAIERVVAGVELGAGEPAIERRVRRVEHLVPAPGPIDRLGLLGPEPLGIAQRALVKRAIFVTDGHDGVPSLAAGRLSVGDGPPQSRYVTIRPPREASMRFGFGMWCVGLCLLLSGAAVAQGWTAFSPDGGRYRVDMPARPGSARRQFPSAPARWCR